MDNGEEINFSWKEIKEAIAEDKYLRYNEKFDLHLDNVGNEEFLVHAIEFKNYGNWEFICLYDIRDNYFYTFANKYENDFIKEKIYTIAHELEATLIGEEGEIYDISEW